MKGMWRLKREGGDREEGGRVRDEARRGNRRRGRAKCNAILSRGVSLLERKRSGGRTRDASLVE